METKKLNLNAYKHIYLVKNNIYQIYIWNEKDFMKNTQELLSIQTSTRKYDRFTYKHIYIYIYIYISSEILI